MSSSSTRPATRSSTGWATIVRLMAGAAASAHVALRVVVPRAGEHPTRRTRRGDESHQRYLVGVFPRGVSRSGFRSTPRRGPTSGGRPPPPRRHASTPRTAPRSAPHGGRRSSPRGAPSAASAPSKATPSCRGAATVPIPGDGHEPLAGENTTSRLPDELTLGFAPHARAELARWPTLLGQLQMLPAGPGGWSSDSLGATAPTMRAVNRPSGVVRS